MAKTVIEHETQRPSRIAPLEPLFSFAPTVESACGRAWVFESPAMGVTQLLSPDLDDAVASFLTGPFQSAVNRLQPGPTKLVRFVHDWSSVRNYRVESREKLLAWGKQVEPMVKNIVVMASPEASIFSRIALQTATLVIRSISVRDSIDDIVREMAQTPPLAALN